MDYRNVKHNAEESRFELLAEGLMSEINYTKNGNVLTITHTKVPSKLEGQGIAASMTKYMLEYARKNGLQISPLCSYTKTYLIRHPEYKDLWEK